MPTPGSCRIVLCTVPDLGTAESIAKVLVDSGLAAGVNIVPGLHSFYRWRGETRRSEECLMLAKTTVRCYPALEEAIRERHPYELPQIVAVPIEAGLEAYLEWIARSAP